MKSDVLLRIYLDVRLFQITLGSNYSRGPVKQEFLLIILEMLFLISSVKPYVVGTH